MRSERDCTSSGDSGSKLRPNRKEMNSNNKQQTETNPEENPFRRSSVVMRSPRAGEVGNVASIFQNVQKTPTEKTMKSPTTGARSKLVDETNNTKRLEKLKFEEEKAFAELGKKLSIANAVLDNAKNVHKTIRDNLTCASLLYQQIREYRDAIAKTPSADVTHEKQVITVEKYMQTDNQHKNVPKPKTNINSMDNRSKRLPSGSPISERVKKKQKTTESATSTYNEEEDKISEQAWRTVESRKNNRRRIRSNQQRHARDSREALTVSISNKTTYAEMLKIMKDSIDPNALGVEVHEMRRTKAGELLIKLKNGEEKAKLLKDVIQDTLGEDASIRCITKNCKIDIRDMDESVEGHEILKALMTATGSQESSFKILNIRESYGRTKQALVQMPVSIASKLLEERRIKIGWIRCRIRKKEEVRKCFRCLDQGHHATECKGADRSNVCRRCCNFGHKSKDCNENLRCILCQESGKENFGHYIGSGICVANRRNTNSKND